MKRSAILSALLLAGAVTFAGGLDICKVNGSIHISEGHEAGRLSTVNGSIRIDAGGSGMEVETVNGRIRVGERATAERLVTVNGRIEVDADARVNGPVSAVNGSITLGRNTTVAGKVSNVNGELEIAGAQVRGGLETVNGDIDVGADSRIAGGILVESPANGSSSVNLSRPPRVVIGPGATVEGTLRFEREVDLYVSRQASIGNVEGATPVMFDGERP